MTLKGAVRTYAMATRFCYNSFGDRVSKFLLRNKKEINAEFTHKEKNFPHIPNFPRFDGFILHRTLAFRASNFEPSNIVYCHISMSSQRKEKCRF